MKVAGILFAFLVLTSVPGSSRTAEKGYHKILGVWEFLAPKAPQPYESGTMTLKEVDLKLTGAFAVQGQSVAIPQIEFLKDTLSLAFEVENTPITLKLALNEGVFEGTTDTPNGPVTVTAKPVKQKTE